MSMLPVKKQLIFFQQLTSLFKAGIPIPTGIAHLREQIDDRELEGILDVIEDHMLRRNLPLLDALRALPGKFPPLVLALVEQGETAGKLDTCFARIVEILEKRRKRILEVYKTLAYPTFIAVVAILLVPIPKAYNGGGVPMYFKQLAIPVGALLAVYFAFTTVMRMVRTNPSVRYRVHKTMVNLPKIGLLVRKLILARFASALALMLNVGLPADRAVAIAARSTENDYVLLSVGPSVESIREGNSLAQSLKLCTVFPASFSGMLATGEATGETTSQLDRLSDMYESEADAVIQMLLNALGPLVLAVVVSLVALQVILFYMEQWDNMEKIYRSL